MLQTHDYMNASVLAFISREIIRLIGNQITLPSLFTPPPSSTVSFLSKSLISPFYPDSDALVSSLFKRMSTSSFNPKLHLCPSLPLSPCLLGTQCVLCPLFLNSCSSRILFQEFSFHPRFLLLFFPRIVSQTHQVFIPITKTACIQVTNILHIAKPMVSPLPLYI